MSELTHLLVTVLRNQMAIMEAVAALDMPDHTKRHLTEHARSTERVIDIVKPKGKALAL